MNELDQLWDQGTEADESWQPVVEVSPTTGSGTVRPLPTTGEVNQGLLSPADPGAQAMAVPDDIWDQGVDATDQWQPAVGAQVPATGAMSPADSGAAELEQMGTVGKLWEAGKVAGSQAYTLAADIVPGTIYRGIRGGDEELAESWIDRQISTNEAERERRRVLTPKEREVTAFRIPFTDIEVKFGDFEDIADNLGYSIGNAIAMFGAKAATKATLGMVPVVGQIGSAIVAPMAGAAAGIAFSARVTKDQFVDDLRTQWMKAHEGELMTPDLEQEWRDFYQSVAGDATIYGLWEAVPETASNMIGWGIMKMGKGKAAQAASAAIRKKLTNKVGLMIAKKLGVPVAKLGSMWSEELLTEMVTTKKQSEIEYARGLRDKPLGWLDALKAVAPAVLLSTPLMAAGFKGAQKIADGVASIKTKIEPDATSGAPSAETAGVTSAPITAGDIQKNTIFQKMAADHAAGRLTDEDIRSMREGMPQGHPLHTALGALIGEDELSKEVPGGPEAAATKPVELDEVSQKHQDVLEKALAKEYPDRDFTVQVVPRSENKDLQAVEAVGDAIGVKVVVFRGEGKADSFNGMYQDGTVYLNENADRPYIATLGHESWHRIRDQHQDLHDEFVGLVKTENLGDFKGYLAKLNEGRKNAGLPEFSEDEALAKHEFMADFVGDQFGSKDFWNALAKKDPGLGQRLAKIVKDLIDSIRVALRSQKAVPASAYSQINSIQDALADVYAEFARREKKVEDQTVQSVAVKTMITKAEENKLLDLGYSQDAINKMKPDEAAVIISKSTPAPEAELTPEELAEKAKKRAAEMPMVVEFNHISKGLKPDDRQAADPAIFDESRPIKDRLAELKSFLQERKKSAPTPPARSGDAVVIQEEAVKSIEARIEKYSKDLDAEMRKGPLREESYIEKLHARIDEETARHNKALEKLKQLKSEREKPIKPAKVSTAGKNVRTLRGAILAAGGIKWGDQFKGERKNMPRASQMLTRQKDGTPWDTLEQMLRGDGWLDSDESLLDALMDEKRLKSDRVTTDLLEKKSANLTDQERKLKKEIQHEPEEPPPGDYVIMKADNLPKGRELTILEDESTEGWDVYQVVEKTKTKITLQDGTTITLKPGEKVQVRKGDLSKKQQEKFEYSSVQAKLPEDLSEIFVDYASEIPDAELYTEPDDDSYGRETDPHVTIRYGLDTDDTAKLAEAFSNAGPIHAAFGKVSIFETDDYDVVKVDLESPDLHSANKLVGETESVPGETFKDYKPHITIAYVKKGEGAKYVGDTYFEGAEVVFDQAELSAKDGMVHPIPLVKSGLAASVKQVSEKPKLELKGEQVLSKSVAMLKARKRTMPKAKQQTLTTAFEEAKDKAHGPGLRMEGEKASKKEAERFKELAGEEAKERKPTQKTLFSVKEIKTSFREGLEKHGVQSLLEIEPESKAWDELVALQKKQGEEIIGKYREVYPTGAIVLSNKEGDRGAIVHKSTKEPGRWQITTWDDRGFFGDTTEATEAKAVKSVYDLNRYRYPAKDAFEQISRTEQFLDGVQKAIDAQKQLMGKGPVFFSVKTDSPGYAAAEEFNENHPGHELKFDGEWDRSAIDLPPMYQFTPQGGPLKGATFTADSPALEEIKTKFGKIASQRNMDTLFSLKRLDELDKKEKRIVNDVLAKMPDGEAAKKRIKTLNGTSWEKATISSALTRYAMERLMKGKPVDISSALSEKNAKELIKNIKKMGEEGAWGYLETKGTLAHPSKPVNSIPGSFLNCNPSKNCSKFCYSTTGRGSLDSSILRAELMDWAIKKDVSRISNMVARHYKALPEYYAHKALRMLDRGEANQEWVEFIRRLNAEGIRTQFFSKRPEILRQISSKNLRLLSTDRSNLPMARKAKDLKIALVYNGRDDLDIVNEFKGRYGVILPIITKNEKKLAREEIELLPGWTGRHTCPIDAGIKEIGPWNCTQCDSGGGLSGCFFGKSTRSMIESTKPLTERRLNDRVKLLKSLVKGRLSDERSRKFDETVDLLVSEIRRGSDPGADIGIDWTAEQTPGRTGESQPEVEITDEDTTLQKAPEFSVKFQKPAQLELPFGEKQEQRDKPGVQGINQRTRMVTTGWFASSGRVVRDVADAAALVAPIRKSAQELAYTIATDANGLVLEIHKYTKGTGGASQISAKEVAGNLMNVRGAKLAYFIHNHPSGDPNPSPEDLGITRYMSDIAALKNIDIRNLIVAGTSFYDMGANTSGKIRPTLRTMKLPVKERYLRKKAGLYTQEATNSGALVKQYIDRVHGGAEGFLFLNAMMKPLGFLPYEYATTKEAAAAVIAAADELGSGYFVFNSNKQVKGIISRHDFIKNLSKGMGGALRLMDIVEQGKSYVDRNLLGEYLYDEKKDNVLQAVHALNRDAPLYSVKREPPVARETAPPFYSQMERHLADKLPGKGTPENYLETIRNFAKKGDFKAEELEWSGVEEWLNNFQKYAEDRWVRDQLKSKGVAAEQDDVFMEYLLGRDDNLKKYQGIEKELRAQAKKQKFKATKQDIIDYLAANNVQIREVVKGGRLTQEDKLILEEYKSDRYEIERKRDMGGQISHDEAKRLLDEIDQKYMQEHEFTKEDLKASYDIFGPEYTPTKHSIHQLPGGENYRELLLTLPLNLNAEHEANSRRIKELIERKEELKRQHEAAKPGQEKQDLTRQIENTIRQIDMVTRERDTDLQRTGYRSSHWDEPNVLAHVRFNERTDADGNKVLFVEEIQSDWHQEGREKGYALSQTEKDELKRKEGEYYQLRVEKYGVFDPLAIIRGNQPNTPEMQKLRDRVDELEAKEGTTPSAPFKKTWPMLAIKRMVRYAAENGFDAVAWTPGQIQFERWGSEEIAWEKQPNGGWRVYVSEQTGGMAGEVDIENEARLRGVLKEAKLKVNDKDQLRRLIGEILVRDRTEAELDKITDRAWDRMQTENIGTSLPRKEGMEAFYDKMLVNEVNKFFNKKAWGEAKVETTDIYPMEVHEGLHGGIFDDTGFAVDDKYKKEVWTLPITPEIRSKVIQTGLPLFSTKKMSPVAKDYLEALQAAFPTDKSSPITDMSEDPFEGLRDDVKKRLQASKGIPVPKFLDWASSQAKDIWYSATRHRPFLDPKEYTQVANVLRIQQEVPENSARRGMQVLQVVVGGMQPKHYETFTMALIMDDMVKDMDNGLLSGTEELPFGFTPEEARSYRDRLQELVDKTPVVKDALRRRQAFQVRLKKALVNADLLPEEVLADDRYFHHQVLEYRALEALGEAYHGMGTSSKDVRLHKKGWQIARKGSIRDYNTDYLQSEIEVISQALAQLETKATMERLKGLTDATPGLKVLARSMNLERLYELEAKRLTEMNPKDKPWTPVDVMEEADPLAPFRAEVSKGLNWLGNMAKKGTLSYGAAGQDFTDVVETLKEWQEAQAQEKAEAKEDDRPPVPIPFPFEDIGSRFWAFLSHLTKTGEPGSAAAATIFKAITSRNKFIKEYLGRDFKNAADVKPDDHVVWKPAPGSTWYRAWTLTDRLVNAVQEGKSVIGPEEAAKFRQILARGKDAEWIIPADIAKTLDGYDVILEDHKLSKASRAIMNSWKKWILINPYRVVKYNVNNMSGDMDIAIAYSPKIVSHYLPKATRDLWQDFKHKEMPKELRREIDRAFTLGVLGSGWSIQEVTDVGNHLAFDKHMEALRGDRPNLIKRAWRNLAAYTTYRENMLRLAAYRYFLDRIKAGDKVYGASNKKEIDGITDPEEKAAKLSRELIGDYGNISHAGQWLRRHIIPFYAWMEINAPRYVRLFKNLPNEGGKAGRGARVAGSLGVRLGWKTAKLGMKASALYALVSLWNATFFGDEEDELGESQRRQLHLILGRRDDGSIISLRIQGALSDALSWFGGEDLPQDINDVIKGKVSIWQKMKDAALAPAVKIINGLRPDVKSFAEVLSGQTFYPDPFNPRPIHDKLENITRLFSLDGAYRWLAGKPKRGDTVGKQLLNDLISLGVYTSDPGESAYYDVLSKVYDFLEKNGRERSSGVPTDRSNALYYYRQALKYGDLKAAQKYLKKYYELGGIDTGITQSIKRAHPLAPLPKNWKGIFLRSLTPKERESYNLAVRWYNETYLKGRRQVRIDRSQIERPPRVPKVLPPTAGITLRKATSLAKG